MGYLLQGAKKVFAKYTLFISLFCTVLILSLISFQGFDVCDEGFNLTFYQQIFNAPETVQYNFVFWLTGIIGGIWYNVFPEAGILSFRLLTIVFTVLTFSISYKLLIRYLSKYYVVLGLLMVTFMNDFGILVFYHNHLSGFLGVCIVFWLEKGLRKKGVLEFCVAGFLIAINIFVRLPNITLFALALIIPVQYFIEERVSIRQVMVHLLSFFIGSLIAVLLVYFAMVWLDHIEIYQNAVSGILNKGAHSESAHNLGSLIKTYVKQYIEVLKDGFGLTVVFFGTMLLGKYSRNSIFLNWLKYLSCIGLIIWIFKNNAVYSMYFLGLIGGLFLLFSKNLIINSTGRYLSFLALGLALLLPMGSDWGIQSVGYVSIWLIVPIFFLFISNLGKLNMKLRLWKNEIVFNQQEFNFFIGILVVAFFIAKSYNISQEAYFDKGNRFDKTYTLNSELASGVYTTKERAEIINPILDALKLYVEESDYLLAYDNLPMLNFLTKTRPYIGNSWVWTYDSQTFEYQLRSSEKSIKGLPVVVQQKFKTIVSFGKPDENYMDENKPENYIYKKGRVIAMNNFLKRNSYRIVWSNSHFNILKPSSSNL